MNEFTQLTWGDPMLAQIGGSDAQAYGSDPAAHSLAMMTTGIEQNPALANAITGHLNSDPVPQSDPALKDCEWWDIICKNTHGKQNVAHPFWVNGDIKSKYANGGMNGVFGSTATDWAKQGAVALLAVVIVAIGLYVVVEA